MPKRTCPFTDDNSRVRKQHHSQADEEKRYGLASIYAKTMQMLMGGAKQNGTNNNETSSCHSCVKTVSEKVTKKCLSCSRQTCVDCLSACDNCSLNVCGMCSTEDHENPYLRVCLGCRK